MISPSYTKYILSTRLFLILEHTSLNHKWPRNNELKYVYLNHPQKTLGAEPNFDVGARQNLAVLKYILTLSKMTLQIALYLPPPAYIYT